MNIEYPIQIANPIEYSIGFGIFNDQNIDSNSIRIGIFCNEFSNVPLNFQIL